MSGTGRFPPYFDHSPYPRKLGSSWPAEGNGVHLTKQDEVGGDDMALIRRMIASGEGSRGYLITLELWRKPPREYPPNHVGDASVGMRLDLEEAAALWASLGEWIVHEAERQADEARAEDMV